MTWPKSTISRSSRSRTRTSTRWRAATWRLSQATARIVRTTGSAPAREPLGHLPKRGSVAPLLPSRAERRDILQLLCRRIVRAMTEPVDRDHLVRIMRRNFAFLPFCGDDACRWYSELFGTEPIDIRYKILTGFHALRSHDLASGAALLDEAERELRREDAGPSSVLRYVERYWLTALAYLQYLNGDLEAAKLSLAQGYEKVRFLITFNRFLIPVAADCTDFIISWARIARRERRWREAERQIELLRDIYLDR